jgi:hypothetical protein
MRFGNDDTASRSMFLRRWALVLAVIQFTTQALVVLRGVPFITMNLTQDDSYYFLQTAWNLPRLGFVTFDGINPTNGVQFLWFWVLVVPALVVANKALLLQAAVVIAAAFNALCQWPIAKIAEHLRRPVAGLLMTAAWFFVTTSGGRFLGLMEVSCHALVFWMWVLMLFRASRDPGRWIRLFAICCVGIVWARADNAFFAVVGFSYVVVRWLQSARWPEVRSRLSQSVMIAGAGAALLLGGYWLMDRSVLPVSALIKIDRYDWSYRATLHGALSLFRVWPPASVAVVLAAFIAGCARKAIRPEMRPGHDSELSLLLVAVTVHLVYLGGLLPGYRFWYLTPYLIACVLLGGLVTDAIIASVGRLRRILVAAVVAPMVFVLVRSPVLLQELRIPSIYHSRYEASLWIRENLPTNAVLAARNAGQLGYFTGHQVINLDGLINSNSYRTSVLGDRAAVTAYLDEQGVQFIINHRSDRAPFGALEAIKSFPVEGDSKNRVVTVWRRSDQTAGELTRGSNEDAGAEPAGELDDAVGVDGLAARVGLLQAEEHDIGVDAGSVQDLGDGLMRRLDDHLRLGTDAGLRQQLRQAVDLKSTLVLVTRYRAYPDPGVPPSGVEAQQVGQ